jgi:hypothetical protein
MLQSLFLFAQKKKTNADANKVFHRCGTQTVIDELDKKYPNLKEARLKNRLQISEKVKALNALRARTNQNIIIPVVVHIILPNPAILPNSQILSQIDVLNKDYQGLNADSTRIPAAFKALFGKSTIQFCLAKKDPNGDPTSGIVRVRSRTQSEPGLQDPVKFSCRGGSDAWDPTKYLNIWVCEIAGDFLGYSFSPSDPLSFIPLEERGFVNSFIHFGKGGVTEPPFNLGRTATHEIGHFFDLIHIWGPDNCDGGQDCSDSDEVDDTPNQESCNYGAPDAAQVITDNCTTTPPGTMWMNYMNYVDDVAMVMYTPQQYNRMYAAILATPWLLQLSNSDACNPPALLNRDIRMDGLIESSSGTCASSEIKTIFNCSNSYSPQLFITNVGKDTIKSLTLEARFGNGTPSVTNWTGVLKPEEQKTIILNPIGINPGNNDNLIIYSKNPNGLPDERPFNDTTKINGIVFPTGSEPLSEGFEKTSFPPERWSIINEDGQTTWERTTDASKSGAASMFINNFDYTVNDQRDWIISPIIPVGGKDSVFLTFEIAAATYSEPDLPGNPTDTLEILMTSDCGITYNSIYKKWGSKLVTTGNFGIEEFFIPNSANWRKDSVYLGDFSQTTGSSIQIAFRNTANYENNIYIDDVSVFSKKVNPLLKEKGLLITPNPFMDAFLIQFYPAPVNLEYVQIYNSAGQLVWEKRIALGLPGNQTGPNTIPVNLAGKQTGMYILKMMYRNGERKIYKILKTN